MSPSDTSDPRRVVVIGGGIAALEAVLALRHLAPEEHTVTVIAPEPEFGHLGLATFMAEQSGHFRRTVAMAVDPGSRTVRCATGPDEHYETLIVAVGASARPAFRTALTIGLDSPSIPAILRALEHGPSRSLAFVVPDNCSWPLPLYDMALMTAEALGDPRPRGEHLHFVTPETAPLDLFGVAASETVMNLFSASDITVHAGINPNVDRRGHVALGAGGGLDVERVISLPVLDGPRLEGLPADAHGFLPVDGHGRVVGVRNVYAAGDASNRAVRQGEFACQQADAVAADLASAMLGTDDAPLYSPILSGRLLTDRRELATGQPLWSPERNVPGRYLGPYLDGGADLASSDAPASGGVDVRLPVSGSV